ncbi:MAG: 3-hydroxyacyl-CoA dehydrogenase/enoyl-CoA hydratase family protein [Acidobacteriota bacterium]
MRKVEKVAVVGAGVMGAAIAAHLANAGFSVTLLDRLPASLSPEEGESGITEERPTFRNRLAWEGLKRTRLSKPPSFFRPECADGIRIGNLEDHLGWLSAVDWIIEAVTEDLQIKTSLLKRVDEVRSVGTLVSSNTSGISLKRLASGLSEDFRRHWLGTHFFNPPRYMKLVEMIPTPDTDPEVVGSLAALLERRLGKGIVYAKDTPNFIANRVGTFALQLVLREMTEAGLGVDEIDQLTGPLIGRPKSATFRTLDIVGLDTFVHVTRNIYENAVEDECRNLFQVPSWLEELVHRGWLGEKSGQGFYRKVGKDNILALDVSTLSYGPRRKLKSGAVEIGKTIDDLGERLRRLVSAPEPAGKFLWTMLSETLVYSANRIPEISDDLVNVDNAMKWGFGWELGPFETWDILGLRAVAERLQREGKAVPSLVERVLNTSAQAFYGHDQGRVQYFDWHSLSHLPLGDPPGIIVLSRRKEGGKLIKKNAGASLIDLDDGVLCLEFHSKMNTIGGDALSLIQEGLRIAEAGFEGLVIGNQGQHFSAGANLMLILLEAQEENWEEIDWMVRSFQNVNQAIKYAAKPVVVAPFSLTLGGGCEMSLHAAGIQAAAETYMGLVELGVGLIPAGGGSKEMLLRSVRQAGRSAEADLTSSLRQVFETIALGKVSQSALDAQVLGFLDRSDGITMNRDRLIQDAKERVLSLSRQGYAKRSPTTSVTAAGSRSLAVLKVGIHLMRRAHYISEFDATLAGKLAYVLCGGDGNTVQQVSEQYILDLEREAFLSLCGQRKTQERIQHMLKTGKPLRN